MGVVAILKCCDEVCFRGQVATCFNPIVGSDVALEVCHTFWKFGGQAQRGRKLPVIRLLGNSVNQSYGD